jgi:GDPmannose 4,6-dehydratase
MSSAIIFGSNGQDGFYLNELLVKKGIRVYKISRRNCEIIGSVSDFNFVEKLIKEIKPDFIFHFAATSKVSHEFLFDNHSSISIGTLNILESVRLHSINSKVFISGSALQFKNSGDPIDEFAEFEPSSIYSTFRIHSVYTARYFREKFNLKIYVGYLFNHDSPLRSSSHVNQKIVEASVRISNGDTKKLLLKDISVKKEFSFAGDIVEAVWLFVNQDYIFESVIGSGIAYSITDWLDLCFSRFNLNWKNFVIIEDEKYNESLVLVSNPKTIFKLGWKQKTTISDLATLMINSELKK